MDSLGQFVLFIVIVQVIHSNADNYCYNTDVYRPQNKHFGTKTAYPIEYGNNSLTYQIPGTMLFIYENIMPVMENKEKI